MKKIFAFLGVLVVLAIICGVGYFVYTFTGEFSTDFKTFYVEIDEKKYIKDSNDLTFTGTTRVDVHYTFEKVQSEKLSFSYKILPAGSDFTFTIDGKKVNWLKVNDLTSVFNVKSDKDGITITAKTLGEVLQSLYPNNVIELPEVDETQSHYKLVVMAEDNRTSITLTFACIKPVSGISLDKENIVF